MKIRAATPVMIITIMPRKAIKPPNINPPMVAAMIAFSCHSRVAEIFTVSIVSTRGFSTTK
ncbi:MAG: hypothetical protein QXG12_08270 [Thermoproteota archaeon]